jgi:hypothetical protein
MLKEHNIPGFHHNFSLRVPNPVTTIILVSHKESHHPTLIQLAQLLFG